MAVTMIQNEIMAREYLEASNWQLENAVQLYYAANPETKRTVAPPSVPLMEGDIRAPVRGV